MKAIDYLQENKDLIVEDFSASGEDLFNTLIETIEQLKVVRISKEKTNKFLKDNQFKDFPLAISKKLENWLLRAIEEDDSFVYSFNFIVHKINKEPDAAFPILIKDEDNIKVKRLLFKENVDENKKSYLKETAKEYSQKYKERLNCFLNEFEADESDFINRELEYFKNTLYDLENSEASHDGHSVTGIENFLISYSVCLDIGFDKFNFSTKKKINFLESKRTLPLKLINSETNTEKYTAKHYLLAYLFECNAKGEIYPIGNKKELERIGNKLMGAGKGNRFYKVFNEITNHYDINIEDQLIEIGGENWRKAVIKLSKAPELVEKYLQSKQL